MFILFPDGDARVGQGPFSRSVWGMHGWYTPHEHPVTYGRWAWCADGATEANGTAENWFEMLDCWFDGAGDGAAGRNGYRW